MDTEHRLGLAHHEWAGLVIAVATVAVISWFMTVAGPGDWFAYPNFKYR